MAPPVSLPVIPNLVLLAQLKGRLLHQNLGHLQLHILELSNSLRDKQFLSEVADHVSKARRELTVKVYDAKWEVFCGWADRQKIDPIQATPQIVADFFTFLFTVDNRTSVIPGDSTRLNETACLKVINS